MSIEDWPTAIARKQVERKAQGLWRTRREIGSVQQSLIESGGQRLLNFSSNDYLGLAANAELVEASQKAAKDWGVGAGASHLVCGHQTPHHQLELRLAEFVGAERVLLFSSGYMANLALNTALLDKGDLLIHDKLNHASLIDGARLSEAQFRRYAHLDCSHAESRIASADFNRMMLVSDGVFSMDGDMAPLDQLARIAEQHRGLLCVDDAHGFGVIGHGGRGTLSHFDMQPSGNVMMMGTLGKAFGCFGAFIAGDALYIEQFVQSARSYIYTTALPANVVAACSAALSLVEQEHSKLSDSLNGAIRQFKRGCNKLNLNLLPSDTPIQPILIGDEDLSVAVSENLRRQGFLVPAIRTPTVAKGKARLRVTLTAAHTEHQVDALIDALAIALPSKAESSMSRALPDSGERA